MEHFSFSPEPPSVRKTPPAGGGGTKVPEGEWVASRSDDGGSFFCMPDRSSLPGLHIPVAFYLSLALIAGLLMSRAAKVFNLPAVTSYLLAGLLQ